MKKLTKTEQFIINESSEIISDNTGVNSYKTFFNIFPALKIKNFQLYFIGQTISLIGSWMQIVAQSWLVLQLTNSAYYVGLVVAVGAIPVLFFTLFGGVIVDRLPKRKVVIVTQIAEMVLAFILGFLVLFKIVTVEHILILSFLLGIVTAIDMPARNSYMIEMVGKDVLGSAIALNSGIWNAARVIGPTIAGILIAYVGIGIAFILNGASFIAVIIALLLINSKPIFSKHNLHPIKAITEGIKYAYAHPVIRILLLFTAIVSVFGWSFTTMLPVIAKNEYHINADGLGFMYAAMGVGAIIGSIIVSANSKKMNPIMFIFISNLIFAFSLLGFTLISYFPLALIFLFFAGMGLVSEFSMINTTLQHMVENSIRGRIMSLYSFMFVGMAPFGNYLIGYLADKYGSPMAIRLF
ncbi:MAG: MFS transporter, partial [bacterium]|nr:MFS transporter [bacterium]